MVDGDRADLEIDWYDGDRARLRPLFELAEDSPALLDQYIGRGRVLVARAGAEIVGHLQLTPVQSPTEIELKSLAVRADHQGLGVGRRLVASALDRARSEGYAVMLVSTAAADVGNLRFYQRAGFRMLSVDRDAFTPATGYPEPILIDGIPLLDRIWFSQDLVEPR